MIFYLFYFSTGNRFSLIVFALRGFLLYFSFCFNFAVFLVQVLCVALQPSPCLFVYTHIIPSSVMILLPNYIALLLFLVRINDWICRQCLYVLFFISIHVFVFTDKSFLLCFSTIYLNFFLPTLLLSTQYYTQRLRI